MAAEMYAPLQQQQQQPTRVQHPALVAPQPPVPPEIEGFLKKLKRKTSSNLLGGSWNKRWFFVDPRRREFGYAASKTPSAPRSSIFLDDITAIVQFDDTHFQVESRTRNFFLCGESKASTSCWVSTLDEYRKKLVAFEKDKTAYLAACKLREQAAEREDAVTATAKSTPAQPPPAKNASSNPATREAKSSRAKEDKKPKAAKKKSSASSKDEPSRESSASSLASRSSSSASSSDRSPNIRQRQSRPDKGDRRERSTRDTRDARRSPSPTSSPEPSPPRVTSSRTDRPPRVPADRSAGSQRDRERERERDNDSRGRGRGGRGRETWRDDEVDEEEEDEDVVAGESVFEMAPSSRSSRGRGGRGKGSNTQQSANAYPSRGHVMQAWIDEDFD